MMIDRVILACMLCACAGPALQRDCAAEGPQGAGAAATPLWANDLTPISEKDWDARHAAHLLERAGFGGTPEEVARLASMTPAQAVDSLVDYEAIDIGNLPPFDPSGIYPHGSKLVPLEKVVVPGVITGKAYGIKATRDGPLKYQPVIDEFYTLLISEHGEMRRAGRWWGERMLLTPRPLEEKLTLFWHDHFATSQEKITNYELMLAQVATLRKHANGNFRDLLVAVAQDPAMLIWLDNRENVKGHPNENFAREIMELFTMGEGRGYTEADIREIARAFTGWTLRPIATVRDDARFVDDPRLHDDGVKSFLGEKGHFNGHDAIDIILKQPATPRFIARKLYESLVHERPSPEVNQALAKILEESKYDLKPLLKTIFLSRDFYSTATIGMRIKEPAQFVISTYRKLGLRRLPGIPGYLEATEALGQTLFYPPNVAGWPGERSWINPATLLARGNFAQLLLFPDPEAYGSPDKIVAEGYRKIPLMFREYHITPRLWDPKTRRMEPLPLVEYDKILAGVAAKPVGIAPRDPKQDDKMADQAMMGPPGAGATKSKMQQVAAGETYNLAVGVYAGFVEALNRVKPMPRNPAELDFVAMARAAKVSTAEAAVDHFSRRLLSVDLSPGRRAAIVAFLEGELESDTLDFAAKDLDLALRRTVHLILSAPEYQLD